MSPLVCAPASVDAVEPLLLGAERDRPRDVVHGAAAGDAAVERGLLVLDPAAAQRRRARPSASPAAFSMESGCSRSARLRSGARRRRGRRRSPGSRARPGCRRRRASSGSSGTSSIRSSSPRPSGSSNVRRSSPRRRRCPRRRGARPRSPARRATATRKTTVWTMPSPARPRRGAGVLEERQVVARRALFVAVEEVVDGRVVLVDGLLHEPHAHDAACRSRRCCGRRR